MAVLALVLSSLVVAAPAQSASASWRAVITFDKNWSNPANSRLSWALSRRVDKGPWKVVERRSWRSGSGMLGKAGKNSCTKNRGWLPNGTYSVRQYDDYPGNLIRGRAFRLEDKTCPNGTRRVDLFVHTEQGARSTQCPNRKGDQVCRWEFPGFNDYKSAGCIKLAPRDLAQLVRLYHRHFAAGRTYAKSKVVLRVVS
jgi:hypothetical protein